ncbi:DUF6281 family protein [Streptomyces chartreusis]|uniref:DUF6281 family protein n=1 Tax=Streptomyces TaxID=1883 RepID=UPI0004CB6CBF|nr:MULTISPECIES: DUF6281 family protein [unclassified Streptomyces]SEC53246.1 hypothetical protein SAMN05428938_2292 [Streptomyces sp. KS_5]SED08136.1 hypothetical protein SAMN05216482_5885 [Streptomyces sp. PAN_FS17]
MTGAPLTVRRVLPAVLLVLAASGCGEGGATEPDGTAAASCAYMVTYADRTYLGTADTDFTVGKKLGTATVPECDDTPNDPEGAVPEGRVTAYAVEGTDPAVAIAVGDTPAEATLMKVH